MWLADRDALEMILPPAGELIWGAIAFGLVTLTLIVVIVFIVRALTGSPSGSGDGRRAERDELLERAVRAEAERDHLRRELEELKRARGGSGDPR